LKEYHVVIVLDFTCGAGSQVFWLKQKEFEIASSDISRSMLEIVKQKKLKYLKIKFLEGDFRTVHAASFDAEIIIFNAIG